jgi:DNA-binding NtrC family response regulator
MTTPPRARVLAVDDERAVRTVLALHLTKAGYDVVLAEDAGAARARLAEQPFDLMMTDVRMPGESGLALLEDVRRAWPEMSVVVMTGDGSIEDAVRAIKLGASDYLIKPVEREPLLLVLDRALQTRRLQAEVAALRRAVDARVGFEGLVGQSTAMAALRDQIDAVAGSNATVLLHGATGTGKELLAHAIHRRSPRTDAPFVSVNCGAIPADLLESELFGHERGAFTGALRTHLGRFEAANGGTLFLDEIGDLAPVAQVKLLRALQSGEIQRVGGTAPMLVDVRIIAATHRDLPADVRDGRFREDLYYRLAVVTLDVPPLAARVGDIPLLVRHFVDRLAMRAQRPPPSVSQACLAALERFPWPGNVRQLEHAVERAWVLSRGADPLPIEPPDRLDAPTARITVTNGVEPSQAAWDGRPLHEILEDVERSVVQAALTTHEGVQVRAAAALGLTRSNFHWRLHRLGLGKR